MTMRLLILGSLPGQQSLSQHQYYAHPRNAFWKIMTELYAWPDDSTYETRLRLLGEQYIGLWDVIDRARRKGSLDSAIDNDGLQVNALATLIHERPELRVVCLNGQKAYQMFCKQVAPSITGIRMESLSVIAMPSTSPAYAAMSYSEKYQAWQAIAESKTTVIRGARG